VRVTVERSGLTVCSPSSMRDSGMGHEFLVHVDVLFIDQFPQCGDFADLFEEIDFILAVAVDGHSSRIIATVFKTLESCTCQHTIEAGGRGSTIEQDLDDIYSAFLNKIVDITDNSTIIATSTQHSSEMRMRKTGMIYHIVGDQGRCES